jgi:hypothetical protein
MDETAECQRIRGTYRRFVLTEKQASTRRNGTSTGIVTETAIVAVSAFAAQVVTTKIGGR